MDETDTPQTPVELLVILAAIADEGIPAETIAPKFSGRFNKGVDYVGDVKPIRREFEQDLAVIRFAVAAVRPARDAQAQRPLRQRQVLDLRAHRPAIRKFDAGLHLKTAGTTWLEELIGLAAAGGEGLAIAKEVYATALGRMDELCGPYATVIDIDREKLPPGRGRASGTASDSPPPCVTTLRARSTTRISASSCTWATRSPPRWARVS